jgi:hypothetical protein
LSALTSSSLRHANLVSTFAWAVVSQGQQTAPTAAAAAALRPGARQQAAQSLVGCSTGSAVEGCSTAAAGGSQIWLVQEHCDRGCLQVGSCQNLFNVLQQTVSILCLCISWTEALACLECA